MNSPVSCGVEAITKATRRIYNEILGPRETTLGKVWGNGSANRRVEDLLGVENLERAMERRIRWAASVYGRNLPILKLIAQQILDPLFETEEVIWN